MESNLQIMKKMFRLFVKSLNWHSTQVIAEYNKIMPWAIIALFSLIGSIIEISLFTKFSFVQGFIKNDPGIFAISLLVFLLVSSIIHCIIITRRIIPYLKQKRIGACFR